MVLNIPDKQERDAILSKMITDHQEFLKHKVPIYRGCNNRQCYCMGTCHEIIGYRDKIVGEL